VHSHFGFFASAVDVQKASTSVMPLAGVNPAVVLDL